MDQQSDDGFRIVVGRTRYVVHHVERLPRQIVAPAAETPSTVDLRPAWRIFAQRPDGEDRSITLRIGGLWEPISTDDYPTELTYHDPSAECCILDVQFVSGKHFVVLRDKVTIVIRSLTSSEKTRFRTLSLSVDGAAALTVDDLCRHTNRIIEAVEAQPSKTAALLRGAIKKKLGTLGAVVENDFTASPHFTNLTWRDNQYVIRGTAAVIIETLYIALKHYGIPGYHQEEVFAQVYGANKKDWPSGKPRIQNFFRTGDAKRLWDDGLIGHDGKGNFHLNVEIHTYTQ